MLPAVLEKTGITAFDLSKVIERFVKHEEILPRELKRHLNGLEEKLLESLAWEKGSALYNSLIVARPGLASEIHRLRLLAEPMPSLDLIAANLNLTHGSVGLPPLPFPKIETGIKIFFSKISKLTAIRIRTMCERMRLSQDELEKVFSLVQQILTQYTFLFFNRHIDQIILCSIYGVSKISNLSLTFKEIILNYEKEPQCQSQLFHRVFIHWPSRSNTGKTGVEYVDIITFYNEVFVPSVKPLLVELGSSCKKCNK